MGQFSYLENKSTWKVPY